MMQSLSHDTQAILLLTAPLLSGKGQSSPDLLTPGEYRRLAAHLRALQRQPGDLVAPDSDRLLRDCQPVIDEARLHRLLQRGFLLSQVIEHWQTRAIWVVSHVDEAYPRRLIARMGETAPAILYGCGNATLLENGGLAVVGSRHVDESLIDYTMAVGRLTARAGRTTVSGGARGIDQAAMRGAADAGGRVIGVLADSLEKMALNRETRNLLLDERLVLISQCDPASGFNVGNAMQRNKLIYALADASLVVSSDLNKGGTWAGATEQLDKLHYAPVFVRVTGEKSDGLEALLKRGALPWPEPRNVDAFQSVFDIDTAAPVEAPKPELTLFPDGGESSLPQTGKPYTVSNSDPEQLVHEAVPELADQIERPLTDEPFMDSDHAIPADALYAVARRAILGLLKTPKKDTEVATALNVTLAQARAWLQRLSDDGEIAKQKKPSGYILLQPRLFELSLAEPVSTATI